MWEAMTFVIFVSVIVQSISVPRSTNVTTPVPVVVFTGTSFAGERFATYVLVVGAVVPDPQLVATAATPTAAIRPRASVLTVLRMKPPGGRKVEARPSAHSRKAAGANDRSGAARSTSGTADGGGANWPNLSRENVGQAVEFD